MRICLVVLVAVGWLMPAYSHAAIVINEIAWMGTETSANDEWIELHNEGGSAVAVTGWTLTDGMNLTIELSGTIDAGDYVVLERTDDSSALGSAFLIYVGALSNTGSTLKLVRDDGGIEDQVAGGENWENIGGDNTTKETAQYTTNGWITAAATPGTKNKTVDTVVTEVDDDDTISDKDDDSNNNGKHTPDKTLELPDVELSLQIEGPKLVYVNQPVNFSVEPSGVGEVIMDSLSYTWNFGDLITAINQEVKHKYAHPGEYVMTVYASYARHEQAVRKLIKVLPVNLTLAKNGQGDIMIHNDAKYEVDISGYLLKSTGSFRFPARSILLPAATIVVPKNKIGAHAAAPVVLFDQAGVQVANVHKLTNSPVSSVELQKRPAPILLEPTSPPTDVTQNKDFSFVAETESVKVKEETKEVPEKLEATNSKTTSAAAGQSTIPREAWPYLGLVALLLVGIFSVYIGGQKGN